MILVTRNERKIEEFRILFAGRLKFSVLNAEYPEIKADEPREVAMTAAKVLAEKLGETVMVEDSGLFITALNGFPGTITRFADKRIGNRGLLKLLKGMRDRSAEYRSAIGYCEPGKQPLCFLGVEKGRIAERIRGTKGWGQDSIFVPQGSRKTYGEVRKPGDVNVFRKRAAEKMAAYVREGMRD
jgi:XTP/dITP diphosphohydrolase